MAVHGHSRVPHKAEWKGSKIGFIVLRCRQDYKNHRLDHEQVKQLESLPGWRWRVDRWSESFERVEEILRSAANETHERNPREYRSAKWWLSSQRRALTDGTLSVERLDLLRQIPEWHTDAQTDSPPAEQGGDPAAGL